ncbi:MAG: CPBP family glutamic-type intramembrane protease [bacterium]
MRRGLPIAVIVALSLLILIPTNFFSKGFRLEIPQEDLRALSKFLSPLLQWSWGWETLKSYAERSNNPLYLILGAIAIGERGDYKSASALLKRAEQALPTDPLPSLLQSLYSEKKIDEETAALLQKELKSRLRGWFRDKPLSHLYKMMGNLREAEKAEANLRNLNRSIILRIFFLGFYMIFLFFLGIFLLILYLTVLAKRLPSASGAPPSLGWGWAIAIIFLFILVQSAISSIPLLLVSLPIYSSSFWKRLIPVFFLLAELVGGGLIFFLTKKRCSRLGISLKSIGWKGDSGYLLWGLSGWAVSFPLVVLAFVFSYLFRFTSIKGKEDIPYFFLTSPAGGKAALLFLIVFLAPLFEELLFRGLLYPSLREELGVVPAIILSSFFFASVHADVSRLLPLMTLGMVFTYLYEKRHSLLPSILAHALWNAQTIFLLLLLYS